MTINADEAKRLMVFTGFVMTDLSVYSPEARMVFAVDILRHLSPELAAIQKQKELLEKRRVKVVR